MLHGRYQRAAGRRHIGQLAHNALLAIAADQKASAQLVVAVRIADIDRYAVRVSMQPAKLMAPAQRCAKLVRALLKQLFDARLLDKQQFWLTAAQSAQAWWNAIAQALQQ